jgi:hypothetical protein
MIAVIALRAAGVILATNDAASTGSAAPVKASSDAAEGPRYIDSPR